MAFNQFKILANGVALETYDDFAISLNYQITDITDITSRRTSFSKTIVIPGTPINNEFFQQIFELNVDISDTGYNPKIAIPCSVRIGDEEVFSGNLQLLRVLSNQKLVEYEIVITGLLKNILFKFGDFYLSDLNLSEYNHERNITNVSNSWNYQIKKNGLDFNATGLGEGYVYPFINHGNSQTIGSVSYLYDMYPAVYVKTVMDKLFDFAGYSYTSSFFNSNYFKSLILPFTSDKLQYSPEELSGLTTTVGVLGTNPEPSNPVSNQFFNLEIGAGFTGFRQFSPVMRRGMSYDNMSNASIQFFIPLEKENGSTGNVVMTDPGNRWNLFSSRYTTTQSGFYDIDFNMNFIMKYIHQNGNDIRYVSGLFTYGAQLMKITSTGQQFIIQEAPVPDLLNSTFAPSSGTHASPWYDLDTPLNISMAIPGIYLDAGDRLVIRFILKYDKKFKWFGLLNDDKIFATALLQPTTDGQPNYFSVKPSSNIITSPIINVDLLQALPNMKMRDFFLSIVKMFNLIVSDDPTTSGNIIIEPKDVFYNSRKKVKDWTYLLDYSDDVVQTPMSELDVRRYEWKYLEDDDYLNKQYIDETKDYYADYEVDFLNEFSNEVKDISIGFAPTPDTNLFIGNRVAPFFADLEGGTTMKPKKVKPRILFYTGLKDGQFVLQNNPNATSSNVFPKYPYCGMWDDPYDPEYDLAFGKPQKIYWNSPVFPNNNLVQMWWSSTISELSDVNAKLLEASFYLTPIDIQDFDFRDIILINNAYYRVNKIIDYNPILNDKTTKVELYKLDSVDFYPPPRQILPTGSYGCPTDIVAQKIGGNFYYVSASGQKLTQDCCNLVGGVWSNGACKVPFYNGGGGTGVGDPVEVSWGSGVSNGKIIKPTGGYNNSPVWQQKPVEQFKNNNSVNSPDIQVLGVGNYVPLNIKNAMIMGDNNVISPEIKNAMVIGDNTFVREDNSLVIGDLLINSDGLQYANPYIIDAGENDVMNEGKTNLIDVIDGGFNSVRNFGGDSKLRPIIDGTTPDYSV
jgi:hypothetical protein